MVGPGDLPQQRADPQCSPRRPHGDGNLDLVLGGLPNNNVTVLLGHPDGSFAAPVTYNNGSGAAAGSIAVGDVTGDAIPDIVTNTFSALSVLRGTGNGTFGAPPGPGSPRPTRASFG